MTLPTRLSTPCSAASSFPPRHRDLRRSLRAVALVVVATGCAGEPGELTGSTMQALTPTGTKTVWVPTPNTPTFASGAWSRTGCTPVTPTTATLTVSPVHGGSVTLSAANFNDPACPGVSFPGQAAFFQYPTPTVLPGSGDDMFQVQYTSSVGTVIIDVTIFEGVTGKALGQQHAPPCSYCQANDGAAISQGDIDAVSTDDAPQFASGAASDGHAAVGAPIELGTGNVFYAHTDYRTAGPNPLTFARTYNSEASVNSFAVSLSGVISPSRHWRTNYDRYLDLLDPTVTVAERPDGKMLNFSLVGGSWTPDTDVDYTLTHSGTSWTLGCPDGSTETYTSAAAGGSAALSTIKALDGYTRTMTYTGALLTRVTDSYSRSLTMTYHGDGTLATMTTPDATTFTYSYDGGKRLQFVNSPVDPAGGYTYQYLYGNAALPYALTGVLDRYGEQLQGWTYDASGRAVTSARGNSGLNADLVTIAYPTPGTAATVTNAQGVTDSYGFTTLQGVPKLTGISRAATATTAAASESFGYDASGYLNSRVDWNGNHTTWVNNSHGLPTAINEAVGTPAARSATITYDPSFPRLPRTIVRPGVTRSFTYDAAGDVLTDTRTDTTSQTVPYATKGQARTTTFTWSNFLPASVKTPAGNTTTFTFSSAGALTRVTDALGHATTVTSVSGGGYPRTVVDPGGVTTTITYDGELRPTSRAIATAAGALTTSCAYWFSSLLFSVTLPDGESLSTSPDTAQRVITYVDTPGNRMLLTLDALGNATAMDIQDASHTLQRHGTATFDALGRQLTRTGVTAQTTRFTWDSNGNPLTVQDGLGHTTARGHDALDRPTTTTDANGGVVTVSYDALNRPLTVGDALGHVTSYVWDGFGDLIQQTSPDSGTTVYRYDADGNLTQLTDATGAVTNRTFDALDRVLTTAYPADPSLNVTSTYDQTGTGFGFGIGRLTSVADAAGSLTRSYDERGNLLSEKRVSGGVTFTTGYSYDGASRLASVTYPSGAVSSYTRDLTGNVTSMPFAAAGADMDHSLWSVQHLPFGPVSFINYNNGDLAFYTYDRDYRLTQLSYQTFQHVPYFQWSYAYDNAGNATAITDALISANSQIFGYDVVNRLTAQTSVNYGNAGWTYDRNGNLTAYTAGGVSVTLGLAAGTNRVSTLTGG
ncbi:MAG TPA: DUF6531 domain-containing protein, partial [Kofleriaceae bacterium]|nr:DUF6531 domain-containing protein [Kofleriaceae bacterium]